MIKKNIKPDLSEQFRGQQMLNNIALKSFNLENL